MARLLWIILIAVSALGNVFAEGVSNERLNRFAENIIQAKNRDLGYPVNQNVQLNDFYRWYLETGLSNSLMNNAGNPINSHGGINSHAFEKEVIEFFAPLYGFDKNDFWGIVTFSGTDGNNHGIYFGAKDLRAKTGKAPVLYVSEEAHYSIKRLADLQNLELRLIPADPMGRMKTGEFEKALDPSKPALIVVAMGTTFKGAIDDQKAIDDVLKRKKPVAVYRHLDAALFGGFLPYTRHRDLVNRKKFHFDSISVSGHKFFGMDEPAGIFLTTHTILKNQNPFHIAYLNDDMPMINCSRSGLAPLKLWWIIRKNGMAGFTEQAARIMESTRYLQARLQALHYPHWTNNYSNTVFFKRPSQWILRKWHLAPDYDDRFGGKLAHIVIMQHASESTINAFIEDLKTDRAADSENGTTKANASEKMPLPATGD